MQTGPAPTTWVDVEDFFAYFASNPRPSGIQRVAFEIMRELHRLASPRLRFVRRGGGGTPQLREVSWADVHAVFDRMAAASPTPATAGRNLRLATRRRVKQAIHQLPPSLREPLLRAAVLQSQVGRTVHEALHAARQPAPVPAAAETVAGSDGIGAPVRPGDHFLVLGAPWSVPGFPALVEALKRRHGLTITLLLYDLIPARHPEWCTRAAVLLFEDWLDVTLPLCDRLLAISRHTAADVEAYARERGIALAGPVQAIPMGTGFGGAQPAPAPRPPGLPRPGRYVLFVSTLEARKNHALAVRVWRRLVDEVRAGTRTATSVPELVFAGRVGWLVADLLTQLDNMAWLGGRVRLVRDPTDAELRALYEGCLFTVVPSLFEGWGLPVTESLAHGKPCLASSATALPEAGGSLCRYFDPEDTGAAFRAVSALLDEPGALSALENEVRSGFRHVPWAGTAQAVLAHLPGGAA